jgi:hypothetical protein
MVHRDGFPPYGLDRLEGGFRENYFGKGKMRSKKGGNLNQIKVVEEDLEDLRFMPGSRQR